MAVILVVDDDAQVRRLVNSILARHGFHVEEAPDGLTALDRFRQHLGRLAALVTDIQMPGMDGVELARIVRAERPDLPVLFVSALSMPLEELESVVPGCAFLAKPFRQTTLVDAVTKLIAK